VASQNQQKARVDFMRRAFSNGRASHRARRLPLVDERLRGKAALLSRSPAGKSVTVESGGPAFARFRAGTRFEAIILVRTALTIQVINTLDGSAIERHVHQFPFRMGRGDDNDLRLDHGTVSNAHAVLDLQAGLVVLTDAQSRNGTWSKNRRRRLITPVQLDEIGWSFAIGPYEIAVARRESAPHATSPTTTYAAAGVEPTVLDKSSQTAERARSTHSDCGCLRERSQGSLSALETAALDEWRALARWYAPSVRAPERPEDLGALRERVQQLLSALLRHVAEEGEHLVDLADALAWSRRARAEACVSGPVSVGRAAGRWADWDVEAPLALADLEILLAAQRRFLAVASLEHRQIVAALDPDAFERAFRSQASVWPIFLQYRALWRTFVEKAREFRGEENPRRLSAAESACLDVAC
jgi:hypothetical protein